MNCYEQLNYAASLVACYPMDKNKVKTRSRGGAHRPDAISSTSTSFRDKNTASVLLCFACGACFVLSLICICLATLVVLLDQAVEATSYQFGEDIKNFLARYVIYNTSHLMLHVLQTCSIRATIVTALYRSAFNKDILHNLGVCN